VERIDGDHKQQDAEDGGESEHTTASKGDEGRETTPLLPCVMANRYSTLT
jgi:hypothetical protein